MRPVHSGETCSENVYKDFDYCILHIDLPDKDDREFETIFQAKLARTREKAGAGDFNFEGAKLVDFSSKGKELQSADFSEATFSGRAWFPKATFKGDAHFSGATFNGDAYFPEATFNAGAFFHGATFREHAEFGEVVLHGEEFNGGGEFAGAKFRGNAMFRDASFEGSASFTKVAFSDLADFSDAMFGDFAEFSGATFGGGTWFSRATFAGQAWLYGMTFARDLQARNMRFNDPAAQETLCRIAKRNCEDRGDRDEADYYHYREMVAKRNRSGCQNGMEKKCPSNGYSAMV